MQDEIFIFKNTSFRTSTAAGSRSHLNGINNSESCIAGPRSNGLLVDTTPNVYSLQFGTNATETPSNTAITVSPGTKLVNGLDIERINLSPNLSQSMGNGRLVWNSINKHLIVTQFKDDALVSNCPRFQIYLQALMHKTIYYRFNMHFKLGTELIPWPVLQSNTKNNVLIFQINPDVGEVPPFNIQIRKPDNDLETHRNIVFLRRKDNYSNVTPGSANDGLIGDGTGEDYILIIPNVKVSDIHRITVDFRPDWLDAVEGGIPYLAIYYNGVKQQLHSHMGSGYESRVRNIYRTTATATGNVLHLPMFGIYRVNYTGLKAPDDCALEFHRLEICQSISEPLTPLY